MNVFVLVLPKRGMHIVLAGPEVEAWLVEQCPASLN